MSQINSYDAELLTLKNLMKETINPSHGTLSPDMIGWQLCLTEPSFPRNEVFTVNDFINYGYERLNKISPFANLVRRKLEQIIGTKACQIRLIDCIYPEFYPAYDVNGNNDPAKKAKFYNSLLEAKNRILFANVEYRDHTGQNKIVLLFTEKELEDEFDFLRGKNWLSPELVINYKIEKEEKIIYSLALFFVTFEEKIKSWTLEKKLNG